MSSEDAKVTDEDTTKMLSDLLIDNAQLRLRLNAVIRNAVNTSVKPEKEGSGEVLPKKTVLNWLLDRWENTNVYLCGLVLQTCAAWPKLYDERTYSARVASGIQDKTFPPWREGEPGSLCFCCTIFYPRMEVTEDGILRATAVALKNDCLASLQETL